MNLKSGLNQKFISSLIQNFFYRKFTNNSVTGNIVQCYLESVNCGELKQDNYQLQIIYKLQELNDSIKTYQPKSNKFLQKIFNKLEKRNLFGLYLWGTVGCGKTMLMDLFFKNCDISKEKKRRTHFHSFMLEIHSRIHESKNKLKSVKSSKKAFSFNPIPSLAKEICNETWLLLLDEFQVTDVGDAMILKYLFTEIFNNGGILIATSNRCPDDLYLNGLQRHEFLPFIPILKKHCEVMQLDSGTDYRKIYDLSKQSIYILNSNGANKKLDDFFKFLASKENDIVRPKTLTILGRNIILQKTCGHIADCEFDELCNKPLGAVDYLSMSQMFHTIIIRNIPFFTNNNKSQARRFITLIDTFYDHKVRVLFSSNYNYNELFRMDSENVLSDTNRNLMDDLGIQFGSKDSKLSIFSSQEESFAFQRTLSRIAEMQTPKYWNEKEIIL